MQINLAGDDEISLTLKEISILISLIAGPSNTFQIAKITDMSYSGAHAGIRKLGRVNLLEQIEPTDHFFNPGKPAKNA